MEDMIQLFQSIGIEAFFLSILILILTTVLKIPIKKISAKKAMPEKLTRFIPLIPFLLGGFLAEILLLIRHKNFTFGEEFFDLWLYSTGLSIAMYSCYENFRDSGKVQFNDDLKTAIFGFIFSGFNKHHKGKCKELAEKAAEIFNHSIGDPVRTDSYVEIRKLLTDYLNEEDIGKIIRQIEEFRMKMYGSSFTEEVKKVACTATEKYEYELKKSVTTLRAQNSEMSNEENKEQ